MSERLRVSIPFYTHQNDNRRQEKSSRKTKTTANVHITINQMTRDSPRELSRACTHFHARTRNYVDIMCIYRKKKKARRYESAWTNRAAMKTTGLKMKENESLASERPPRARIRAHYIHRRGGFKVSVHTYTVNTAAALISWQAN